MSRNWPAWSLARPGSRTQGTSASPACTAAARRRCPSITRKPPSSCGVTSSGIRTPVSATDARNCGVRSRSSRTLPGWAVSWSTATMYARLRDPTAIRQALAASAAERAAGGGLGHGNAPSSERWTGRWARGGEREDPPPRRPSSAEDAAGRGVVQHRICSASAQSQRPVRLAGPDARAGRRRPPGGQAAAPRRKGPASPAGPGGQDVSRRAQDQRRRSRHQQRPRPGKDLWPPGASAARGRLREPTQRRRLTQPGRPRTEPRTLAIFIASCSRQD